MLLLFAAASVATGQPPASTSTLRAGGASAQTWATVRIISGRDIHFGEGQHGPGSDGEPQPHSTTLVIDGSAVPASLIEFP